MVEVGELFYSSAIANFRMLFIMGAGALLVLFGFLKKDGVRGLGGVVSKLLLPCLIFSNIIKTFNPADTSVWFPILLFISICRLLGMGCGYVLGKILRLTGKNMKFAMTVTGFSHHTSIQLLFIDALQETLNQLKTTIPLPNSIRGYTPYERGIYYVVLNSIVSTFWAWGVAFQLLSPPENEEIKDLRQLYADDPTNFEVSKQIDSVEYTEKRRRKLTLKHKLLRMLNFPVITCFVSILFAIIPFIYNILTEDRGILKQSIMDSADSIGRSVPLFIILSAGGNLAMASKYSEQVDFQSFTKTDYFIFSAFKLIIFPMIGVALIYPLYLYQFIKYPVLAFVLLLQFTTPADVHLMIICNLHSFHEEKMSKLLLIQYSSGIITMTFSITLFLYLLS